MPKPCKDCPFRKDIEPGFLGGSPPETYVGQIQGPFHIPCHKGIDYSDEAWRQKAFEVTHCVGAASLRTSIGVAPLMPASLSLPEPCSESFDTLEAFYAHHRRIPLEEAQILLDDETKTDCLEYELRQKNVIRK